MRYMTVANVDVAIIEHKGQRVLTTSQVAQVYECEPHNIKKNFNDNKNRFVDGKHYFKLEGEELRRFKDEVTNSDLVGKNASVLYLWTKQGASRHCKMLGTDRAWEMFDCLEENYFNPKRSALPDFTNPVIAARAWADAMEKKQLAESQVKELAPKAEFYDTVADSESLMSMADTCKILDMGIGRNKLFALLREKGILQKDNMPYQRFVDAGYFKVVEGKYEANENVVISKTTYVKQKGIDYIRKLLSRREGIANAETD
jgi:phage antirepressor YoqD-like protein